MLLSQLLQRAGVSLSADFRECEIEDIIYDSRKAAPDTIFIAIKGANSDGHNYTRAAYHAAAAPFCASIRSICLQTQPSLSYPTQRWLAEMSALFSATRLRS